MAKPDTSIDLAYAHRGYCRHFNGFPPLTPEAGGYGGCHNCHADIKREDVITERTGNRFDTFPCYGPVTDPDAKSCPRYQTWNNDELAEADRQRLALSNARRKESRI